MPQLSMREIRGGEIDEVYGGREVRWVKTPSAIGERQMLPRQMKRIERGGVGGGIGILVGEDDGGVFFLIA